VRVELQPSICIVGSGPSGCYLAQFLIKQWPEAQIVILDRLDHPYGLALYGVAPDHHGTRAVTKQFDRIWANPNVSFIGNTMVGRDVSVAELRDRFDIVVLATGLYQDRMLPIKGAGLKGIEGAGRVTRLINGHPNEPLEDFSIGQNLVVVGQGNVAIDIVRLCLTNPAKLKEIGVPSEVIHAIQNNHIRRISVVGRSRCDQAKFDTAMVKELATLENVRFQAHNLDPLSLQVEPSAKVIAIQELVSKTSLKVERTVDFYFGFQPLAIAGASKVAGITFASVVNPNQTLVLEADTIITAIGFEQNDDAPIRLEQLQNSNSNLGSGFLAAGLYCVGWLRRGPTGTIPANRADARLVSDSIIQDFQNRENTNLKPGLTDMTKLRAQKKK
jgi:ferredoxin--NADP+ reductase